MVSIFRRRCHVLGLASAIVISGCAGGGALPSSGIHLPIRPFENGVFQPVRHYRATLQAPDRGRSWMLPGARAIRALLYVSDHHTNDVYVYNYKTGAQAGKLTGFHGPYGQCVDAKGNVWIVNYSGHSVVQYAHGGTRPVTTLATNGNAIGCAFDSANDLYVTNITTPGGAGDLQVWTNASGTPANYSNPQDCYYLWPPGFGPPTGLVAETNASGGACELLGTLRADNTPFDNFSIGFPAGTMWDGEYLTLADQEYNGNRLTAIYQTLLEPCGGLFRVGQTILNDTCNGSDVDVVQPFVVGTANTPVNGTQGTIVVGGNLSCKNRVDYWAYPTGGLPVKTLKNAPLEPFGASVSLVP